MPLLLVQAFVNTLHLERQLDLLDRPEHARAWFADTGLLSGDSPVTPYDLSLACDLRAAIRGVLESGGSHPEARKLEAVRELADTHRLRFTVGTAGILALDAIRHHEFSDALFELMLVIHGAQRDGSWARLKICANSDCKWAFYDRSRNQHGNWCDMAVCGNRVKNRRLYARGR